MKCEIQKQFLVLIEKNKGFADKLITVKEP